MVCRQLAERSRKDVECFKTTKLSGKKVPTAKVQQWLDDPASIPNRGFLTLTYIDRYSRKKSNNPAKMETFKRLLERKGSKSHFGSEHVQAKLIACATGRVTLMHDPTPHPSSLMHDASLRDPLVSVGGCRPDHISIC